MQAQTIHYIPPMAQTRIKLRVAAYARVSSDSSDQLESYAAQVKHYDRLIRQNPQWELVDIYADEGLTGTRADTRDDFQRLMKDCRRGKIDKVLVKSISRFARNSRDCLTYIRELKTLGVGVLFERENIDTGDMGSEMVLAFYGAAAQEESLSISGNMRWSYQRRFKSGEFITCSAPYGYRLVKGDLLIDENKAIIVRRIFEEYLSGTGTTEIAERLADESIPKKGGHWTRRSVEVILQNEKYAGNALLQKSYTLDEFPFKRALNKGERTQYYVENSHPAIISQEALDRAQALMRRRNADSGSGSYPFSLMIHCGLCGASFKRRVVNGKVYWRCRTHDQNRQDCPAMPIPEPVLKQAFLRLHHKLATHRHTILTPLLEQLTTLRQRAAFRQERILEIDKELLQFGRQTMLLHRLYSAGHMDAVHYYTQSQSLNRQVNALRQERRQLIEDDRDDETIEQTTLLSDILKAGPEKLEEFEPEIFRGMVRQISITEPGSARFALINGLEVVEQL